MKASAVVTEVTVVTVVTKQLFSPNNFFPKTPFLSQKILFPHTKKKITKKIEEEKNSDETKNLKL